MSTELPAQPSMTTTDEHPTDEHPVERIGLIDLAAVHRPTELAEARTAVLAARESGRNLLIHGGGTKLAWGNLPWRGQAGASSPARPWDVIDTRSLNRLIHHEPGDMTAIVQAGMPLPRLRKQLADAGQQLAVDPPMRRWVPGAADVTVGGVYVANDAGPRRFSYGGIRDLVIGTTVVLADGTVSRSGGTVIKNVAGYDLGKLWCGSLGTLGLVTELTLRLHPLPEATRTLLIPASAARASSFVVDLLASPVECAAIEWSGSVIMNTNRAHRTVSVHDHGSGALLVALEGRAAGLSRRVDQLAELVARHDLSAEPVDDDGDGEVWDAWREAHAGKGPGCTVARAATLPSQLADAVSALDAALGDAALRGAVQTAADGAPEVSIHSHAGLGLHDAVLSGGDVASHAAIVRAWRERIGAVGGTVTVRDRPVGLDDHVDPWDQLGSAPLLGLSRAVKRSLDPDGRFAPGRFAGGI
ncbi:FAD-binding oxidoreductase [Phytoactinopolyspora halotolerans]|uniref:FAD-binding oxidoreductase n=1 Tax=Phytoactinopolyspora halotolerans TaxID=1981512 RepID=A0A6L9SH52_9ACTN|nr:FAD-binding oxidoreductase [Phytoactinopolyspora halotolerans]NEE03410.1 FAD-binding oxidoreductase [Phytoactinopolyspora halotolerans]